MSVLARQPRPHRRRPAARRPAARGAFTLTELIMGMIVTGLVMSAIAALLSAVAMGWQQSGDTQESATHRVQTHARLHRVFKGAKQIGAVRAGSTNGAVAPAAAAMLWKGDANGDGKIQFSELALVAHEGAVGTPEGELVYYDVAYPSNWSDAQVAEADGDPLPEDEIFKQTSIGWFVTLEHVRRQVLVTNVVGAKLARTDGANVTRPSLDYVLTIHKGDGAAHVEYGTASVRPPAALPPSEVD